jgi:nucleoid-associated protein EbfC
VPKVNGFVKGQDFSHAENGATIRGALAPEECFTEIWSFAKATEENTTNMINPLKISEMLSKAGEMQEEVQRKLGETVVEASSGGGAVTATMNGKKELLKIHIDPAGVMSLSGSQADVEMLENLIVGAVNEAGRKADEAIKSSVQGMLGGLKIPGLGS